MALVLIPERDPEKIDGSERTSIEVRCIPKGESLELRRTDPAHELEHLDICTELQPAAVVLRSIHDRGLAIRTMALLGIPHYIFMQDQSGDGSNMGRRLHKLLSNGEFVTKW